MARKSAGISERHRKIMQFLTEFQEDHGYSPSIREIGKSINVDSTSLVDYYLKQLDEQGYIERNQHISRSIRVIQPMPSVSGSITRAVTKLGKQVEELVRLPIIGRIQAGEPIPVPTSDNSIFDAETSVEIARSLLSSRDKVSDLFALEVQGDSMIDAMINDGDIVIMKKAIQANNGEMVAVWLDDKDETTLKYFYREDNRIRLQPANPSYKPIFPENPEAVRIMGKVVMVIRQVRTVAV
jgi:repressor LexA